MLMPGKSYQGELPELAGAEADRAQRMKADVMMLAETIGERNTARYGALLEAEKFLASSLASAGYETSRETYEADNLPVSNVIAELPGSGKREEIIVIGAHYDSAPGTPGANDNASAVAGLLELARMFGGTSPKRTLRFVAFANEEPPYSFTDLMGSRVHAVRARSRSEHIGAMICLECLGVYSDVPGSQLYPPPLERFFPDRANFISFVSNMSSYPLLRKCIGEFRRTTLFPSEGIAAPERVKGISWSDHWSFWQEGYQAIMVTDTAFFRYRHYHIPSDTAEKLDYERMARVVGGLGNVLIKLALG